MLVERIERTQETLMPTINRDPLRSSPRSVSHHLLFSPGNDGRQLISYAVNAIVSKYEPKLALKSTLVYRDLL